MAMFRASRMPPNYLEKDKRIRRPHAFPSVLTLRGRIARARLRVKRGTMKRKISFSLVLFVALALILIPLVGVLSVVAMFAIIRHAQFRRVRTALVRGKSHRT